MNNVSVGTVCFTSNCVDFSKIWISSGRKCCLLQESDVCFSLDGATFWRKGTKLFGRTWISHCLTTSATPATTRTWLVCRWKEKPRSRDTFTPWRKELVSLNVRFLLLLSSLSKRGILCNILLNRAYSNLWINCILLLQWFARKSAFIFIWRSCQKLASYLNP